MKVKEPVAEEYHRLREGLTLFTYLHLAADEPLTKELVATKITSIAYETVQLPSGLLPLLYPMSEVAGCLAPQVGAHSMMKAQGGRGVLMGGIGGVANSKVVVIGAGVAGPERREHRARHGRRRHPARHRPRQAADELLALRQPGRPDRVVGDVDPASRCSAPTSSSARCSSPAPRRPSSSPTRWSPQMKPGSVLVDVAIDQGGCFENSRPTTHADPTFEVHDSIYYCVANMPGAVPHTSTWALTNATMSVRHQAGRPGLAGRLAGRPRPRARPEHARRARSPTARSPRPSAWTASPSTRRCPDPGAHRADGPPHARGAGRRRVADPPRRRARRLRQHPVGLPRATCAAGRAYLASVGVERPDDVREADVTEFLARLREGDDDHAPLAATSAARTLVAVRGLHRFLALEGVLDADPARRVSPPKPPSRLPKAIPVEDVERLLEAASVGDTPASLRDRALLEVLYGTGARISRGRRLDVDDLEGDDGRGAAARQGRQGADRAARVVRRRARWTAWLVRGRPAFAAPGRRHAGAVPQRRAAAGCRGRAPGRCCERAAERADSRAPCRRTPCATRSRRTCSRAAPTCASCRSCSGTRRSRRPRSTRSSRCSGSGRCTPAAHPRAR